MRKLLTTNTSPSNTALVISESTSVNTTAGRRDNTKPHLSRLVYTGLIAVASRYTRRTQRTEYSSASAV